MCLPLLQNPINVMKIQLDGSLININTMISNLESIGYTQHILIVMVTKILNMMNTIIDDFNYTHKRSVNATQKEKHERELLLIESLLNFTETIPNSHFYFIFVKPHEENKQYQIRSKEAYNEYLKLIKPKPLIIHYDQTHCSICMSSLNRESITLLNRCNHLFHITCIRQWQRINAKFDRKHLVPCPLCKQISEWTITAAKRNPFDIETGRSITM